MTVNKPFTDRNYIKGVTNMDKEKNSKKRILRYYLILGACVLIIAAITVSVIFTVNGSKSNVTLDSDKDQENPGGDENGGSVDTSTKYEFISPVEQVDLITSYIFYKNSTLGCYHFHTGVDLAAAAGTQVMATLDGTVESITAGDLLDGTVITLSHENGIKTTYKFIDAAENLAVGDSVSRGDVIGTVAAPCGSEYKEGAHLHFEVSVNGEPADPEDYLDISVK